MNPRRYKSAAAFKQAVEQRLRDQATRDGVDMGRLRQLLVFDRYIARLIATFGDDVVIKGGMAVELQLARARTTKDLDLRLESKSEDVLAELQEAGRLDLGDFLRFEVRSDPRSPEIQAEGMLYQGRRFRAHATLAGKIYAAPFGIDVVFAGPLAGELSEIESSSFLAFAGVLPTALRVYPLEAHIAEKLHAYTMPRNRPNSRVKDLPDIALLATVRALDAAVLRTAIDKTFTARRTHAVPRALARPPIDWTAVYERGARNDDLPWKTIDEVHAAAASFLDPVLSGCDGHWSAKSWQWTRGVQR